MNQPRNSKQPDKPKHWWERSKTSEPTTVAGKSVRIWLAAGALSIVWWIVAGQDNKPRLVLMVGLSLASFMVGCMVGFLFTSYGEEAGSVGKVRDWLVGGITAITITQAGAIKRLLVTFAAGPGPNEFALTAGVAVTYSVLGFFFMFFERDLVFNPLLAEGRLERGRVEGTRQAGQIALQFLAKLPQSILSGVEDVDDILNFRRPEADKLRDRLDSDEVKKFLDQADQAVKSGTADWDIVSTAANLSYYAPYFEKDDEKKMQKAEVAEQWILRALAMNPLQVDFTAKHAAILGVMNRYNEAVAILEGLDRRPETPAYVKQWLGYFLAEVPDRLDDSIRYSQAYHAMFPGESDALYNIAKAYAKKYCRGLQAGEKQAHPSDRHLALSNLKEALDRQPAFAPTVRDKWTQRDGSFHCLLHDQEFRSLVGLPAESAHDA